MLMLGLGPGGPGSSYTSGNKISFDIIDNYRDKLMNYRVDLYQRFSGSDMYTSYHSTDK